MSGIDLTLAFDAYGTLLSTESIAKKLASHFGDSKAATIAATWRKYQLEYTWRMNSMGVYENFTKVTQRALCNALAESSVSLDEQETEDMMKAYNSLTCFPDVEKTMLSLKKQPTVNAVVFSNGTKEMVTSSVENSPDLSPYAKVFDDVVVVEDVKKFKPCPEAYHDLVRKLGGDPKNPEDLKQVWLVSGNPFDVVGARAVGLNAIWVDRAGNGWQDALIEGEKGQPTEIVSSLDQVVSKVMYHSMSDMAGHK